MTLGDILSRTSHLSTDLLPSGRLALMDLHLDMEGTRDTLRTVRNVCACIMRMSKIILPKSHNKQS